MKYISLITSTLAGLSAAAPYPVTPRRIVEKRQSALSDVDILQFALTLEHLETAFYAAGLQAFNQDAFAQAGFSSGFFENFQLVGADEATHVTFLEGAITAAGANPVAACDYSFPVSDLQSFLAVSSILEGVGVSAYLGAAASIQDKSILTAAASIMTVESRHSAFVRETLSESPNPSAFDTPLSPTEVFTLASTFITACPSTNPPLPFTPFPPLQVASNSSGAVSAGQAVNINTPGYTLQANNGTALFAAFITVTGPVFAEAVLINGGLTVVVPQGLAGQNYMVVTSSSANVTDATVAAGPVIIEIRN